MKNVKRNQLQFNNHKLYLIIIKLHSELQSTIQQDTISEQRLISNYIYWQKMGEAKSSRERFFLFFYNRLSHTLKLLGYNSLKNQMRQKMYQEA